MREKNKQGPTIAAVVITKNEETNIRACLESLQWANEIIVVDAESTDGTVAEARRFTDKVFVRPWPGFGPQKNFGFDQTQSDWILIVDADERVTDELRVEIQGILGNGPSQGLVGYEVPRRNFFYGFWMRFGGMFPDYQIRLVKKSAARYDDTLLHENLRLQGFVQKLQSFFDHHSIPTITHHVRKMIQYTSLAAQEKLKHRDRVTVANLMGNHLVTVFKTYVIRGGWRDGLPGLIAALFAGMHTFVKYAKAYEKLETQQGKVNLHDAHWV